MQGKKPTRNQRKILEKNNLDPRKWYIQKDASDYIQIIHVDSNEVKIVYKM